MKTSIFIKTCKKDLIWLDYCLRSIWKYAHGISEVVIVADMDCRHLMRKLPVRKAKVEYVNGWPNGYVHQQFVKIMADSYVSSEMVLFVDSDCVFFKNFSISDFMRDDKPIWLKTRYVDFGASEVEMVMRKWKGITSDVVGWEIEWEYMRRLPTAIWAETLRDFRSMFPGIESRLRAMPKEDHGFSEFNVIGAFVDRYQTDRYFISNTMEWVHEPVAKQFWSWGGITPEVKAEIMRMLR